MAKFPGLTMCSVRCSKCTVPFNIIYYVNFNKTKLSPLTKTNLVRSLRVNESYVYQHVNRKQLSYLCIHINKGGVGGGISRLHAESREHETCKCVP